MAWSPDYCTVSDLKQYLSVEDSADDAEMGFAIAAASRAVDRTCNRQFGQDFELTARYYTAQHDPSTGHWVVPIDDLQSASGVTVAFDTAGDFGFTGQVPNFRLGPVNAAANGRPYTLLYVPRSGSVALSGASGAVRVTAMFGWSTIPSAVTQATLIQASRFLARRDSPFGIAGSPDAGSEMRLLAKVDPDVEVALAPYRRWWAVA